MTEFGKKIKRAIKIGKIIACAVPCMGFMLAAGSSFYNTGEWQRSLEIGGVMFIAGIPTACLVFIAVSAVLMPNIPEE